MTLDTARATVANLERHLATLDAAERARDRWDTAKAARGAAPVVPAAVAAPVAPDGTRPDTGAAETILRAHAAATAARATAQAALTRAQATAETKRAAYATAEREAAHYVAWLSAVRRAPGACLADSAAALGDLGPVALTFPDTSEGGRYVVATFNGNPWEEASTGERYLAGLYVQIGLRRAAKLSALPVFCDEAQSINGGDGPWPADTGIVYLLTTSAPEIVVGEGAPA